MAKINPNRMELLKLKKRLVIAKRGHKLLKEKFDELVKNFLALVHKGRALRQEVNSKLAEAYQLLSLARSETPIKIIDSALSNPKIKAEISVARKTLLNTPLPLFDLSYEGELSYSLVSTPAIIDTAMLQFKELLPEIVKLAQLEKSINLLATEIEKTRRRVNALEYVLIPGLESSSRFITMKLDEVERDARTRTMKIKEMMGTYLEASELPAV